MSIIGIDLGTTNSLVSVYREGKNVFISNEYGEILTPSVVSIDPDGKTVYVGKSAKSRMIEYSDYTASLFKRSMGTDRRYKLGSKSFDAEELSSFVLKKLIEDAKSYLNEEITEAVISVPAYFNEKQRRATKRAGELAGVKVERLVNEPSAAALMSRIKDMNDDKTILIFDFGGGTLDISYAECFENIISVLAISGNNQLGGKDFDHAIAKYFCLKNDIDISLLSSKEKNKLFFESEQVKIKLSNSESVEMNLELEGKTYSIIITREDVVNCSSEIFQNIEEIVKRVFRDAEIETNDIDEVILVGGSSKMPVVQQYIQYLMPTAKIDKDASDTIVGMGVGTYAGIKAREKGIENLVLTDICPFSLGINIANHGENGNPLMSPIIKRNTPLPAVKKSLYATSYNYQKRINFGIYQGEHRLAKNNMKLGEVEIDVEPYPEGHEKFEVTFAYDLNGLLAVETKNIRTNEIHELILEKEEGLSIEEKNQRLQKLRELKMEVNLEVNPDLVKKIEDLFEIIDSEDQTELNGMYYLYLKAREQNSLIKFNKMERDLFDYIKYLQEKLEVKSVNNFDEKWFQSENNR